MKIIKETCTKGTRIILGNEKRQYINECIDILIFQGFVEIQIPILQDYKTFENKVGEENNNLIYRFTDRGNRDLVLAPEYTSVIMNLKDTFKYQKDVKLFYVAECFRAENNQFGRFRQFTQLGIEIVNPTDAQKSLILIEQLSLLMVEKITTNCKLNKDVTRGLDYYESGKGFEITCEELGSSKQVCGGGIYTNGVGSAVGVDRILLLNK
jgi:histidyl-tRNA synthetase